MAANEKELNAELFDQLTVAERLKRAYDKGEFEEEYEIVVAEINRKLYQKPPLVES